MPLTYLYTRLRLSLARLVLVTLLERNDRGLEALAKDMSKLLLNYKEHDPSSILWDYFEMLEEDPELNDIDPVQLRDELDELLEEVMTSASKYAMRLPVPRAVHFEFPDILVIEYPRACSLPELAASPLPKAPIRLPAKHAKQYPAKP